ncbi:NAD(P)H-dependent oxidoreductase [Ewingella allii]|uniref:NAD(P)H-dependent oxidoreductase n=1 Tax=Ewingella allii TaxID=3092550 RepID=UPI0037B32C92
MHTLIVVSHPIADSLTHAIAKQIAAGITGAEGGHSVEIADLAAEDFDPRFTATDMNAFNGKSALPQDVLDEQARVDRADALILVYPIYWWSMPGQLKGWIDRVFANGWAYEDDGSGKVVKKLLHLKVHLVALGGADMRTFARHGYFGSMKTQIDHGIFDYCGAPVLTSELIHTANPADFEANLALAKKLGQKVVAAPQRAESLCA